MLLSLWNSLPRSAVMSPGIDAFQFGQVDGEKAMMVLCKGEATGCRDLVVLCAPRGLEWATVRY